MFKREFMRWISSNKLSCGVTRPLGRQRKLRTPSAMALLPVLLGVLSGVPTALAANRDCGQPKSTGSGPRASDALEVLRSAVGISTCDLCVCDVTGDSKISAGDALATLRISVGQNIGLHCPSCEQFQFTMEITPDPARPGEVTVGVLHLTNISGSTISNVAVDILLPVGMGAFDVGSTSGAPASCGPSSSSTCSAGEKMVWNVGTLAAGAGLTLTMPPTVSVNAIAGTTLTYSAIARIGAMIVAMEEESVVVANPRPLDLSLRADADPVEPGATITYDLSFGNPTAATLSQNGGLTMPVPVGTIFVSASDGAVPDEHGIVHWSIQTPLLPGKSGTRQLTVTANDNLHVGEIIRAEASIEDDSGVEVRARADARVASVPPLVLTMEMTPDPASPGEVITGVLHVGNTGALPLTGLVVDVLISDKAGGFHANTTSGAPVSCETIVCSKHERIVWTVGDLPAGAGATLTFPPSVGTATTAGSVVTFEARARDANGNNAAARRAVRVESPAQLDLSLRADADPVEPGATITYDLSFGNPTAATLSQNAELTMPIPLGTTFVSASDGAVPDENGIVHWSIQTPLLPGKTGTRQLTVTTSGDLTDGQAVHAEARIEDSSGTRTQAFADVRVASAPPLLLTMEMTPDPASPGEVITGVLHVGNTGALPLTGLVVDVLISDKAGGFYANTTSGAPVSCETIVCSKHERIVWTVGDLPAGAGATLTFPPSVGTATTAGSVATFEARARDANGNNAAARRAVRVESAGQLDLSLRADADPVEPGAAITYDLSFGNPTAATLSQNAELTMPVPVGTTFVSASDGALPDADGVVHWNIPSPLLPGKSGLRQLTVTTADDLTDGQAVHAEARIEDSSDTRTQAFADVRMASASPLVLTMEMTPDPASPGEVITGVLHVGNTGALPLTGLVVDVLISDKAGGFHANTTSGAPVSCVTSVCSKHERIVWTVGDLPAGAGATLTFPPSVGTATTAGSVVTFEARARDANGNNAAARRAVRVESPAQLDLSLRADADPVEPGATITYDLSFGNPTAATSSQDAVLSMPIPIGTTFVSATEGAAPDVDGVVHWNIPSPLLPGKSGFRQLVVATSGDLENGQAVHAEATFGDNSSSRTQAFADVRVAIGPPLLLTMEMNPDPVSPGGILTGALHATNVGSLPLVSVIVDVLLPDKISGFYANNTSGSPVSCNTSLCSKHERVIWTVGTIAVAGGATLTLPPPIAASVAPGTVVTFEGRARDGNGNNAAARRSVRVTAP